ncbi:MAG: ParB/RepB/Spo0J family partition protein [Bacteroidales bacterium]|jgi:ParB family chromosome partitioning protein|nr:ParB/RepB/Spo0J family partition protein [Bacteroidales bacterium]
MAAKQALGRGLGALLHSMETVNPEMDYDNSGNTAIAFVDISKIDANPHQPRKEFSEEALQELSQSIKEQGVIVPITITKGDNDRYILIAGERRLRAAKLAGLKEIPAYIRLATKNEMMEMALVENIQREDLNAIEIALSLQALIESFSLTQEQVSQKIGKSRSTTTNYLRLLKLPAQIQIALQDDVISMGHARALINLESEEEQLFFLKQIIDKKLPVTTLEKMVASSKNKKDGKSINKSKDGSLPIYHDLFKAKLSEKLSVPIEVKRSKRGKGTITIPFSNDKDFERIVALIGEN